MIQLSERKWLAADFEAADSVSKKIDLFITEQIQMRATEKERTFCDALRTHLMREPTFEDASRCTLAKRPQRGSFDVVEDVFYDEIRLGVLITKTNGVFFIPENQ